jgi:triosephosphate isomerase
VTRAQESIVKVARVKPTLFRAPFGARWPGLARAQRKLGLLGVMWTVIGRDWKLSADAIVNRKLHAALSHNLRGILCVGETKPERDSGAAAAVVIGQLQAGLAAVAPASLGDLVIAYEPVWAIGTGDTATPDDAQAMHATIRRTLSELYGKPAADEIRIQYGGSVKPDNVDELMSQPDIDGALVGGAALKADSFLRIIQFR